MELAIKTSKLVLFKPPCSTIPFFISLILFTKKSYKLCPRHINKDCFFFRGGRVVRVFALFAAGNQGCSNEHTQKHKDTAKVFKQLLAHCN